MRLAEVHGALVAAYGRSSGQVTGSGKSAATTTGSGKEADRKSDTQASSGGQVQTLTQGVEKFMQNLGVELKFNVTDSGEVQAEVRHPGGDKVIRKIPPDEVLELAESIKQMTGAFVDKAL